MQKTNFSEWFFSVLPLLLEHKVERIDADLIEGHASAYWVNAVLRIDIKPAETI